MLFSAQCTTECIALQSMRDGLRGDFPLLGVFARLPLLGTVRSIAKEPAMQATTHRAVRPLPARSQPPMLAPVRSAASLQQRAQLDGLEVRESSFGDWLAAGGDRRSHARGN
jgi:hypothetical protein